MRQLTGAPTPASPYDPNCQNQMETISMSKKDETLAAKVRRQTDEMGEMMWRNAIADTVLKMLETGTDVTKANLKSALESGAIDEGKTTIERAVFIGALKALDGNPPY